MDLISKPRTKSSAWLYFGLKADEKGQPLNSEEAICRLCRKIVLTKGGNTTNLRSHLKRHHPADFLDALSSTSSAALPLIDAQGDVTFSSCPSQYTSDLDSLLHGMPYLMNDGQNKRKSLQLFSPKIIDY